MTISEAMDNLVEEVRTIGLGEYFDGLDYEDIIENALDAYRRDIIARADEIKEDMYPDGDNSESVVTWVCPLCLRGTDCSCVKRPANVEEWDDRIEETDYLEEDDE